MQSLESKWLRRRQGTALKIVYPDCDTILWTQLYGLAVAMSEEGWLQEGHHRKWKVTRRQERKYVNVISLPPVITAMLKGRRCFLCFRNKEASYLMQPSREKRELRTTAKSEKQRAKSFHKPLAPPPKPRWASVLTCHTIVRMASSGADIKTH